MEKHLLVTIGDDMSALYGVRFVSSFFQQKDKISVTLLYVASSHEASHKPLAIHGVHIDSGISDAQTRKGRAALEASRRILLDNGFSDGLITCRLVGKRFGTAKDIVHQGKTGLFDAVVLGRRGYTIFEKTFATSITREIMDLRIDFPVWVCKRPEHGRRNVLLCIDDTEPSMRIVDHVGFMLEKEGLHQVTLMHVDNGEAKGVEDMMKNARRILLDNGVAEDRVKDLIIYNPKVADAILAEAERGQYAVVAVGRGGTQPKGVFKKWVTGSVSAGLLETLEKAVLWVSK